MSDEHIVTCCYRNVNLLTGVKDGSHRRVPDHRKFYDQGCVCVCVLIILDSVKLLSLDV